MKLHIESSDELEETFFTDLSTKYALMPRMIMQRNRILITAARTALYVSRHRSLAMVENADIPYWSILRDRWCFHSTDCRNSQGFLSGYICGWIFFFFEWTISMVDCMEILQGFGYYLDKYWLEYAKGSIYLTAMRWCADQMTLKNIWM